MCNAIVVRKIVSVIPIQKILDLREVGVKQIWSPVVLEKSAVVFLRPCFPPIAY